MNFHHWIKNAVSFLNNVFTICHGVSQCSPYACPQAHWKAKHAFVFFFCCTYAMDVGLLSYWPIYTPGRVTQVLAKHVSMFLSVLERICHEDTEPYPFTLSQTDVQGPCMLPCTFLLASCTSSNLPDPRFNKLFKNIRKKKLHHLSRFPTTAYI